MVLIHVQTVPSGPGPPGRETEDRPDGRHRSHRIPQDLLGHGAVAQAHVTRAAEYHLDQESGDADCQDVDCGAGHHLVGAKVDRGERVQRREEQRCEERREHADPYRSSEQGAHHPAERTDEHESFHRDVHDAGALADRSSDRRERNGRGEPDGSGEEVRRDDARQQRGSPPSAYAAIQVPPARSSRQRSGR